MGRNALNSPRMMPDESSRGPSCPPNEFGLLFPSAACDTRQLRSGAKPSSNRSTKHHTNWPFSIITVASIRSQEQFQIIERRTAYQPRLSNPSTYQVSCTSTLSATLGNQYNSTNNQRVYHWYISSKGSIKRPGNSFLRYHDAFMP